MAERANPPDNGGPPETAPTTRRTNGALWVYLALAAIGLIGTAWFNVDGIRQGSGVTRRN